MKELIIYTDGSHLDKQHGGRLGIGGVLTEPGNNKPLDEFSQEISGKWMQVSYGAETCSNPTMELFAALYALGKFKNKLKGVDKITLKADYQGVSAWMNGAWRIKESYIERIKSDIDSEIRKQGLTGKIAFEWVRGHQRGNSPDVTWNNYVDKLAKGESHD